MSNNKSSLKADSDVKVVGKARAHTTPPPPPPPVRNVRMRQFCFVTFFVSGFIVYLPHQHNMKLTTCKAFLSTGEGHISKCEQRTSSCTRKGGLVDSIFLSSS